MEITPSSQLSEKLKHFNGKKILHFGSLAGWPYTLAQISRKLDIPSENWIHQYKDVADLDRQLSYDWALFSKSDSMIKKVFNTLNFIKDCPEHFCLIHYHSTTFLHREYHWLFEGPYLKHNQIPMVLSLGGGDARPTYFSKKMNKFYYKKPDFLLDLKIRMRWLSWRKNIAVCATDPEMAVIAREYFDNVEIFRQPIDLSRFPVSVPILNKKPLLLHVPTEPEVKGTQYILNAVENLQKKGLNFEFKMARQLTQNDFYKLLATCDVYIDELRCGSHGVTAVEAMAMGKPTISYIREDLIKQFPEELPLVNANPDTIESVLERLIVDAQHRMNIGNASRLYVEKYHDAEKVLNDLASTYLKLLK